MRVVVPYSPVDPKTRLGSLLTPAERRALAACLLDDVLSVLPTAAGDPLVLSPRPVPVDAPVRVDERPLSAAVNGVLASSTGPVAVVMADLGLLTPSAFDRLLAGAGDVVIAPGRGGGTNALVVDHPAFRVDYHDGSYRDHLAIAESVDATVTTVDSFRLATDIDEPADLAELLLHGRGSAPAYLRTRGFELDPAGGRTTVKRSETPAIPDG